MNQHDWPTTDELSYANAAEDAYDASKAIPRMPERYVQAADLLESDD